MMDADATVAAMAGVTIDAHWPDDLWEFFLSLRGGEISAAASGKRSRVRHFAE